MWKVNLNIFIYALYIQAAIVILTVIATYVLYFVYKAIGQNKKTKVIEIKKYLLASVNNKDELIFKKKWSKLLYLVLAIHEVEREGINEFKNWKSYKIKFIKKYLLPRARKKAKSIRWFPRFLAANVFAMYAEPEDEKSIACLIQDRNHSVAIEAVRAIKHVPTEYLMNLLIDQMALYRRKSYDLFLLELEDLPVALSGALVNRLKAEKDPYKRDICYRILLLFTRTPLLEARDDANSKTLELRLSALRFIAHSEGKNAVPFLQQILEIYNSCWRTKVVILQLLGKLNDVSSLKIIKKMTADAEPWVRFNARKILENF